MKYTNFNDEILRVFKSHEYLTWYNVVNRLQQVKKNRICLSSGYYRAWQDLTVNGRLQEGINNTYRINQ